MLGKIKGNILFIDDKWQNCDKQECQHIVFMGNLWYKCDKQEYHNSALYKRLSTGDQWHKCDQYKCHNIARKEKNPITTKGIHT